MLGYLSRHTIAFHFRDLFGIKNIAIFLINRERIEINQLPFPQQILNNSPMTAEETSVNHDNFLRALHPSRNSGIWYGKEFAVTGPTKFRLPGDEVGGYSSYFTTDARPFT